jgi:hypothetical protein
VNDLVPIKFPDDVVETVAAWLESEDGSDTLIIERKNTGLCTEAGVGFWRWWWLVDRGGVDNEVTGGVEQAGVQGAVLDLIVENDHVGADLVGDGLDVLSERVGVGNLQRFHRLEHARQQIIRGVRGVVSGWRNEEEAKDGGHLGICGQVEELDCTDQVVDVGAITPEIVIDPTVGESYMKLGVGYG